MLTDDASLVAMLFEAGQQEAVSSDAVMDVLVEALKTGRKVEEIVDDKEILSRRQRESILEFIKDESRHSAIRRKTLGVAGQYDTPAVGDNQSVGQSARPSEDAMFLAEYAEWLPTGAERYVGKEEIGKGGWGVVVRAEDRQLRRDVAVKKLSHQASTETDVARRFLHEARITGQLQHPGIVPVYERGISLDDKQPFYAMKLLDGVTFREVIKNHHALPKGAEKRASFLTVLNCFVDVCQAIAYAHDKNIIHRDLKPSNVVVGEFGETVVVDWGLAKDLSKVAVSPELTEETLAAGTPMVNAQKSAVSELSGLLDPVMTQAGSVIGTPAFMSPEQARGATSEIDTRSDAYALGVILYVILTGKPPFHGEDVQTTLKQVAEGKYQHPKAIDGSVPAPLASICVKAMSRERADRYQNAGEIAEEIHHYLANETVSAHKYSLFERAGGWCRRHPAIAATTIVGTLILAVASMIGTAIVSEAHRTEKAAKQQAIAAHASEMAAKEEAVIAKERAFERLEESRAAADTWLIGLSGTLERYPGLEPVRRNLIEQGRLHYQKLHDSSAGDPSLQLETARSLLRLGDLHLLSNEADNARQSFTNGVTALSSIVEPQHAEVVQRETVNAEIGLALCSINSGTYNEEYARELFRTVSALQDLVAGSAEASELYGTIARGMLIAGRGAQSLGDNAAAVDHFELSQQWAERLVIERSDARALQLVSTVREDLAVAYAAVQDHVRSARILQDHIDAASQQIKAEAGRPDLLESRAIARMRWAGSQRHLGEDWAAEGAYRGAVEDLSQSWQLLFGDHYFSENLAIAQANLGQLALQLNRIEDAEKMLREAVDQLTGLMQSGQADRETASRLAACNVSLGYVLALQQHEGAEQQIQRSIDIFEYLAKESTVSPADRISHGQAFTNLGRLYLDLGQLDAAVSTLNKSVAHFQAMIDEDPMSQGQFAAASAKIALAEALQAIGNNDSALPHHRSGLDILSSLADVETSEHQVRRGSATTTLMVSLLESIESQRSVERATQLLSRLKITSMSGAHLHQLQAIVRYRTADSSAKSSIENAMAGRRFPVAVDQAIRGCILVQQGETAAATAALDSVIQSLNETPGDRRLRLWASELSQLLQLEESPAAKSIQ